MNDAFALYARQRTASARAMPAARAATGSRPLILHISSDYPDPIRNRTTPAIKNFIDHLDDCDHIIVSLKRYTNPAKTYLHSCPTARDQKLYALGYWALPGGVLHRNAMSRVEARIGDILSALGVRPHLVMAHKLAIEGVVAYQLWKKFGLPYVCSIRGEVEDKYFRLKPELRGLYGKVATQAEALFLVSAWFRKRLTDRYPIDDARFRLLPNFCDPSLAPVLAQREPHAFVTVLDLNMYRRKGFHHLIRALALAHRTLPGLRLDVIGWSGPKTDAQIARLIERAGVESAVRFLGPQDHRAVLEAIPRYTALVLPARNETFGMVYVEALLTATPILYTADSGIDGYLEGVDAGIRVRAGDVRAIASALQALAHCGTRYQNTLAEQHAIIRARFSPAAYLAEFRKVLTGVLNRCDRAVGA